MDEIQQRKQSAAVFNEGESEIRAVARVLGLTPFDVREALILYAAFTGKNIDKIARLKLSKR